MPHKNIFQSNLLDLCKSDTKIDTAQILVIKFKFCENSKRIFVEWVLFDIFTSSL